MSSAYMLPALPSLGSLPYDLDDAQYRLNQVRTQAEAKELSEASTIVFQNEVKRISALLDSTRKMIDRIVGGKPMSSDTPKQVQSMLTTIRSGIDGLYEIVGNGTVLDWAKNNFDKLPTTAKNIYEDVKEEVDKGLDEVVGKAAILSPFLIIILALVLAIFIFARKA